jgi:hypothetical protein
VNDKEERVEGVTTPTNSWCLAVWVILDSFARKAKEENGRVVSGAVLKKLEARPKHGDSHVLLTTWSALGVVAVASSPGVL